MPAERSTVSRCEICELPPVEARCSGLDVPSLDFCREHGQEHERICPEVAAVRATVCYLEPKEFSYGEHGLEMGPRW
jgi:hypothetical protein